MNNTFLLALLSTVVVSLIPLVTLPFLWISQEKLKKIVTLLVSLAIGGMLGDVFFHILPESIEHNDAQSVGGLILAGILIFFAIEKSMHWHHHEDDHAHHHTTSYLVLFGDTVHNFIDGILIGAGFLVNPVVGWSTALAVALHELPQELGDYGILIHAGFSRKKALLSNLISACAAILGTILALFAASAIDTIGFIFMPIAAGGFLYISLTDLIPALHRHREKNTSQKVLELACLAFGIAVMYILTRVE